MTDSINSSLLLPLLHVLVVAHPDDESLFFLPTIRNIQQAGGGQIWLLCLTNGNYDGLGKIRSKELFQTCQNILKLDRVILLEEEDDGILDDPHMAWHIPRVAICIQKALEKALLEQQQQYYDDDQQQTTIKPDKQPKTIVSFVTFDEQGVSGHINHRDTYQAVRYLFQQHHQQQQQKHNKNNKDCSSSLLNIVDVWKLQTESNLLFKYAPMYCWILLLCTVLFRQPKTSTSTCCCSCSCRSKTGNNNNGDGTTTSTTTATTCRQRIYRLHQPCLNWQAMASHASQFVWYRRLFVVFSCYTYVNRLIILDTTTTTTTQTCCCSSCITLPKKNKQS